MALGSRATDHRRMDAPPTEPHAPDPTVPLGDEPPPAAARPPHRLVRRLDDRLLGGVAAGVAGALDVDVVLVRVGFVVAAFFGGLGVIAYLLGWFLLPVAPATSPAPPPADRRQLWGYALLALGLVAVGGRVGWSFSVDGAFWPLVLIGAGVAVLWLRSRDDHDASPSDGPTPRPPSATAPAETAPAETAPVETAPAEIVSTEVVRPDAAPDRPRSYLGRLTASALLVLLGTVWVLDASGVVDLDLALVAALALLLVGAGLLASAWFGRARGLIALGVVLMFVVGLLGFVDVPLRGGIGDPTYHPRAAVHGDYSLAIGNLSVDLRDVDFAGRTRRVHAQLGIGQLNVTVPTGVRVVVDAHAGVGSVTAFGDSSHECCPTDVHVVRSGSPGGGTLHLDADVGAGHADISRGEESLRATS
jgi:phage shock protein PspC (stress-responsive transcriptional regulator)